MDTPSVTPESAPPPAARPPLWRRFWARSFDLAWQLYVVAFGLGLLLALFVPERIMHMLATTDTGLTLLNPWFYLALLLVPLALLLDALVLRLFGNTPGKALLGLKLMGQQDQPALHHYLRRNVWLWIRGLGLSIPFVSLITMLQQFMHTRDHQHSHYDLKTGFRVLARPVPLWRTLLFAVLLVGLYGINFLPGMNQPMRKNPPALIWQNPETQQVAVLPGHWKVEVTAFPTGNGYAFNGPFTLILFLPEQATDIPLEDLVFNFILATAEQMKLNPGRYSDYKGLPHWRAQGAPLKEADHRIQAHLIQSGDTLWRVLAFQRPPYHPSLAEVEQIQTRLLDTLPRNPPSTYTQRYP
jgi:hypothetical protein